MRDQKGYLPRWLVRERNTGQANAGSRRSQYHSDEHNSGASGRVAEPQEGYLPGLGKQPLYELPRLDEVLEGLPEAIKKIIAGASRAELGVEIKRPCINPRTGETWI